MAYDLDDWKRIGSKMLGGLFGDDTPVIVPPPAAAPVIVTPDYTLPLLALGGLGILMLAGSPKRGRRRRR
jgi:hypothetical protein